MLLSPRTAMMSLIAVPAALLANIVANMVLAPVGVAQDAYEQTRSQSANQSSANQSTVQVVGGAVGGRNAADGQNMVRQPSMPVAQRIEQFSLGEKQAFSPTLAVPRQVLLIDLNPVLDFGALGEWDGFSQPLDEPTLLDIAPADVTSFSGKPPAPPAVAPALEPAMRAGGGPARVMRSASVAGNRPSRLPQLKTETEVDASGVSPFAAALAPRSGELAPAGASASRTAQPAQPPLQSWDAPFPSLGQLQLDRQLRRYLTYLDMVGQPDILIVGGQGAVQGVDPLALQESLGDRGYKNLKVFNWGLSDSSAQTVEWLLTELLTPQQLPKLVVWADTSVALNGGRQDSALGQIRASLGHRFLARGLRPKISDQEKTLAQKLGQILDNPLPHDLPDSIVALARSLGEPLKASSLDWSSIPKTNAKADRLPVKQEPIPRQQEQKIDAANVANTGSAVVAQAVPISIDPRARVLPILSPQKPLPVAPASTRANGLANPAADLSVVSGFRLVNWCRNANGPCQAEEGQSPSALVQPAVPAWLRQAQAAQEAQQQAAQSNQQRLNQQRSNQPRASRSATLQSRLNQTSVASPATVPALALPDWPQSQAAKQFLQAMGFQSVDQRLGASQAGLPRPLRGDLDRDYGNFSLQGDQNRALHRLVQFGQQQGMAIAFVPLPLSQQYLDLARRGREQSFRTYLDVAAQMTPLHLLELPGDGLSWNDALFAQPNRLNRYGAAVLSWQIGQALDVSVLRGLR